MRRYGRNAEPDDTTASERVGAKARTEEAKVKVMEEMGEAEAVKFAISTDGQERLLTRENG